VTTTFEASLANAPVGGDPGTRRGWVKPVLLVVGAVVLVALVVWALTALSGGRQAATTTVDASTEPDGLLAFALLLQSFDAQVSAGGVDVLDGQDIVLLLPDVQPTDAEQAALDAWVERGGVRVVAGGEVISFGGASEVRLDGGSCDIAALREVEEVVVDGADGLLAPGGSDVAACLTLPVSGPAVFVTSQPDGLGTTVALGGVSPFTNALLDVADNAVLATSLFAPTPGTRVLLFSGSQGLPTGAGSTSTPSGGSDDGGSGGSDEDPGDQGDGGGQTPDQDQPSLLDEIPVGVRFAFLQLIVVFVLYAWARGRRVGEPVSEPQPVDIDGSELVLAVGDLLARTKSPERSAAVLRTDVCRRLASRVGLAGDADPHLVATTVAARTGGDADEIARLLAGPAPTTDDGLIDLARRLDALREELFHGIAP